MEDKIEHLTQDQAEVCIRTHISLLTEKITDRIARINLAIVSRVAPDLHPTLFLDEHLVQIAGTY